MSTKDFVSSAINAEPHAALAWAGVCVLLPVGIEKFYRPLFISEIFHHLEDCQYLVRISRQQY